ncbi:MAG: hypothetical protein H8E28_14395 [Anaerolineae bacterium]|nr:hypothetical protein [Anaerolineae bacterium]
MIDYLQKYLEAPTIDPDHLRKARLLNILAVGLAIITSLAMILVGFMIFFKVSGWENLIAILWSGFAFLFGIWVILALNRKGEVFLASAIFLLVITFALTFSNVKAVGAGATQFYFVIPILIASVIVTPAASFVVAAINSTIFIIAALAMNLEPNFYIGIFGMFAIAVVSWISAQVLENALKDLREINIDLDRRVETRTQELAEANERLKGLDELKSRFVSDVSHELRTPISNLSIYLEMLEEGDARNTARYLAVLREETSRLKKLVADVLDLSRMETGTVAPQFEWRCINDIAEKVFIANQLRADVKGLQMEFIPADDLPKINMDGDQLIQALNNLVGNSVNYTDSGHVIIRTSHRAESGQIVVEISDTGMGIADEDIDHIFDRFYRGKRAGQSSIPGTGLGLAITKEIIERHGGEIQAQSVVGQGTTFSIYLPVQLSETG